jgi:hypothetical protein
MKEINYTRVIPSFVGPKLAYHGFKYDEDGSYPPEGDFSFARIYWGKSQRVNIGPVQHDHEAMQAVTSQATDSPTEVPKGLLRLKEPGFQMWLSNRYVLAVLEHEGGGIHLYPNQSISEITQPFDPEEVIRRLKTSPPPEPGSKLPFFWEFHGEDDLRRVLSEIVRIIVTDGMEWFEQQVADIRRQHEKLDLRRNAAKKAAKPQIE